MRLLKLLITALLSVLVSVANAETQAEQLARQLDLPVPRKGAKSYGSETFFQGDTVDLHIHKGGYADWMFRDEPLPGTITDDESLWQAAEAWLAKHHLAFEIRGAKKTEPNGINLTWMISHNGIPVSSKAPITMIVDRTQVIGLWHPTVFLDERPKMTEAEALQTFLKLTKSKVGEVKAVGLYYGSYMSAGLTGEQYKPSPMETTPRLFYGFDATVEGGQHLYAAIGAADTPHPNLGDRKGDLPDPRIAKYRVVVAAPPNYVVPTGIGGAIALGVGWWFRKRRRN